jgi:hypothetical protein
MDVHLNMNYSKPGSTGMQMDASMDVSMDVSMDPNGSKTPCYGTWKRERERDRGRILENGRECHIICHFIWETIWSATSLIKYIFQIGEAFTDVTCCESQLW